MAIRWIKKAWEEVTPQTIINCFKTTGALPQDQIEEDPFAGLDEDDACDTSLDEHVQQIDPGTTADDYVAADDDLNTCLTFGDTTHWREEL